MNKFITHRFTTVAVILLLLLAIFSGYSLYSSNSGNPEDSSVSVEKETGTTQVPAPKDGEISTFKQSEDLGDVNGIPQSSNRVDAQRSITQKLLQAVNFNDPELAISSMETFRRCANSPISQEQINSRSEALEKSLNDTSDLSPEMITRALREDKERSERCSKMVSEANEIYESEISQAALDGNPVARYIYALWEHGDVTSTLLGSEALSKYEKRALRFTQANIEEGHKLGLLAMGLSYLRGTYFTTNRQSLGLAYVLASQLCGVENSVIDHPLYTYEIQNKSGSRMSSRPIADESLINAVALDLYENTCN